MRPTTIRLACTVVAAVVALTVAELTSARFREFMSDHSLISTFIAESILLPNIVDAARSAAQAIVPAPGRLRPVRGRETGIPVGGWTEDDRRRFKDSLLEILRNESKFDQRLPP
jgi:hypothetical protein